MRIPLLVVGVLASLITMTTVFVQPGADDGIGGVKKHYLPEYADSGELILPKNFNEWVFVGLPITPNGLNNGKAGFPEYHNVYIEPGSYAIYKSTGVFPEGTIYFKELHLVLPDQYPDGSRNERSGRGYFPGKLNGADVTVKASKLFAYSGRWGYFNFNHHEPKAATAKVKPNPNVHSATFQALRKTMFGLSSIRC